MSVAVTELPIALGRVLEKADLTGRQAAMVLGTAEQTVSRWRTGRKSVNPESLQELARRTPGAAPEELTAAHALTAGMLGVYDAGDYQDHPMVHMEIAAKEDRDEDRQRDGVALILGKLRERATEAEVERVRRYNLELAQEIQAKLQQLAANCAWVGDSLTDTMKRARIKR